MKSTYTPAQYQKMMKFLDEEDKVEVVVSMAGNSKYFLVL